MKTHRSSDGTKIDGAPRRECGCQSCRHQFGPPSCGLCEARATGADFCGSCQAGILVMNAPVASGNQIQKCDVCALFETDDDAAVAVRHLLGLLSRVRAAEGETVADAADTLAGLVGAHLAKKAKAKRGGRQ